MKHLIATACGLLLAGWTHSALADAIDGDWCREGKHFRIEGPSITTEGGNSIAGNYDRHGFSYIVPDSEPGAGGQVNMMLMSEELLTLTRPSAPGAPETWKRCEVVS
ncbi:MAG: hypothetical protein AB7O39_06170 [Flavobacteriaceae bacterium]